MHRQGGATKRRIWKEKSLSHAHTHEHVHKKLPEPCVSAFRVYELVRQCVAGDSARERVLGGAGWPRGRGAAQDGGGDEQEEHLRKFGSNFTEVTVVDTFRNGAAPRQLPPIQERFRYSSASHSQTSLETSSNAAFAFQVSLNRNDRQNLEKHGCGQLVRSLDE